MKRFPKYLSIGFVLSMTFLLNLSVLAPAYASITFDGDVDPDDSLDWNSSTNGYVGYTENGSIEVSSDILCSQDGYLGYNANSSGEATITGSGSTWTNSDCLFVGHYGEGMLHITSGGIVNSHGSHVGNLTDSTGAVTIDGNGSTWNNYGFLNVGFLGQGTLDITNEGTLYSSSLVDIDSNPSLTSVATVDGNGSTWTSDSLRLGSHGNGILNITNGGEVSVTHHTNVVSQDSKIHFDSGGTLTTGSIYAAATQLMGTGTINTCGLASDVDLVFDSTHDLAQTITLDSQPDQNVTIHFDLSGGADFDKILGIGVRGTGSLNIRDRMVINSSSGILGHEAGSMGIATVDGIGSTWNNQCLGIGANGEGILHITGGGTVTSSDYDGCSIGCSSSSTGTVTVTGTDSKFICNYALTVGDNGNGTLNVTNGGTVESGDSHIGLYGSNSTGTGMIDGVGSVWANNDLCVGFWGQGTLAITNDGLASVAGRLTIDQNTDGDSFINMSDGGMLALTGDADESLAAFFDLIEGTDAIQWWDPDHGGWYSLASATMGDDYTLEYIDDGSDLDGYTLLTVDAIEPSPGDANCDGQVNGSDATLLASYWQAGVGNPDPETITWAMGDFNGDGQVDGSDATLLACHWQEGGSTANAVPEPTGIILLATLLMATGIVPVLREKR